MAGSKISVFVAHLIKHVEDFYGEFIEFTRALGNWFGYIQTLDIDREILDSYGKIYGRFFTLSNRYPLINKNVHKEMTEVELKDLRNKIYNFYSGTVMPFSEEVEEIYYEAKNVYELLNQSSIKPDYKEKYKELIKVYLNFFKKASYGIYNLNSFLDTLSGVDDSFEEYEYY